MRILSSGKKTLCSNFWAYYHEEYKGKVNMGEICLRL